MPGASSADMAPSSSTARGATSAGSGRPGPPGAACPGAGLVLQSGRGGSMASDRRLTVYIVEDSRTQADIARALLEKAGHFVTVNQSSADALRDIPCRQPDCVLLDLMMPGVDGYEVCRR